MFATWALYAAALVAASSAAGIQYDPLADLDEFSDMRVMPVHHAGHRHHHHRVSPRHLRHLRGQHLQHRHHKLALAHHFAEPRMDWNPDGAEDHTALRKPSENAELPGRHPSVEKALGGMGQDLQDLHNKKMTAKQTRGELEGKVTEAVHHMNDAMSIKHAITKKEAELRIEGNKLATLEHDAEHMDETHSSLVASLHRVLEPKVKIAQERLAKREMVLAREQQKAKGWHEKTNELHEHALELLNEKKMAHQSLLQAENEVEEAKKREELARGKYESQRRKVAEEVQSFRYAETRFKAEAAHEQSAKENAVAAEQSVSKLNKVLEVESVKVEESVEVSKSRIHHRMEDIQARREKTKHQLEELKERYHQWQENERARAAEVVQKASDTAVASEAYADEQKQVLDAAQKKVVNDAETSSAAVATLKSDAQAKSDWAWESGSDFGNDAGFTDSNPSLSD